MLTIISLLTGFGSSVVPEILKFFRERGDRRHELAVMKLQMDQARLEGADRLRAIRAQGDADLTLAQETSYQHAQVALAAPSGIGWIDGWKAAMRPLITTLALALLCWRIAGAPLGAPVPDAVWTPEVQFMVEYIIAFWFGERLQQHARGRRG